MRHNLPLNTDSYKPSHWLQYPKDTQTIYSYIESRGGVYDRVMFFGLQMFIKEYLMRPITRLDILEAESYLIPHGVPFNKEGWEYILDEYDGKLPIRIRAVPEGSVVGTSNVLLTMENTDPKCFWLTNYLETALMRAIWYPTTVGTYSFEIKGMIKKFLEMTSDNPADELPFKLHDFGSRGVSSLESAGLGGLAHLVNFKGTDTIEALRYGREYYKEFMAGFSIPASEHSTMTSWGKENESKAYKNMLDSYPGKMVAVVSDSYDIYNAVDNIWGKELKQNVIDHGAGGGALVIRPDSGIPWEVIPTIINSLMKSFGYTTNSKGYKVLPPYVRVIQGDGVDIKAIERIYGMMEANEFSGDNIAFGMGGALLQRLDRDSQQFAMKCCAIQSNGEWRDVYKSPVGDKDMSFKKASKPGRMTLIQHTEDGRYTTERWPLAHHPHRNGPNSDYAWNEVMRSVFYNGSLLVDESFKTIRERAEKHI